MFLMFDPTYRDIAFLSHRSSVEQDYVERSWKPWRWENQWSQRRDVQRDIPLKRGRDLMVSDTPEDFIRDTVTLLQDADRRREMGNTARLRVKEDFGLDQLTEVFERIHEDVMQ